MRLLILGVGDPVPTFIYRRISALARQGVKPVVMLVYKQANVFSREVEVVRYGSFNQMGFFDFVRLAAIIGVRPKLFLKVFRALEAYRIGRRIRLATRYFPAVLPKGIDLIHVQWLGMVPEVFWLKSVHHAPLVASARGSQITVYPRTRPGYTEVVREALRLVNACHVVSKDLLNSVLALGTDREKLFVNYNGIDLNRFKPSDQQLSHDHNLNLISVGALIWRKGYTFQLSVLHQLRIRNVQARLMIVGEGGDREGLIYTAKTLGLDEYVKFTGKLLESQIIEHIRNSDVYLSTSLAEGLPNSVVEAAACGLPVVAFDCEGIREVVEHEVSGYVVDSGKVDEMVNYLEILKDATIRVAMRQRARQRVEQLFDQHKCVAEMIAQYQRIIDAS